MFQVQYLDPHERAKTGKDLFRFWGTYVTEKEATFAAQQAEAHGNVAVIQRLRAGAIPDPSSYEGDHSLSKAVKAAERRRQAAYRTIHPQDEA